MIKHVYLIKLKQPDRAREVADRLLTMRVAIPEIADMEVGVDFKRDANSYDICEICVFRDEAAFRAFGAHPFHAEIREYVAEVSERVAKVDYTASGSST